MAKSFPSKPLETPGSLRWGKGDAGGEAGSEFPDTGSVNQRSESIQYQWYLELDDFKGTF